MSGLNGREDLKHDRTEEQVMNPKITVLMPIYNASAYLEESFGSLLAQDFDDFEVVCINDGSTDSSLGIIQRYCDKDIRFRLIDKMNSGYGASMNFGLEAARGDYIAILEPDDFFEPQALSKLYQAASDHNADIVKANYWFYWSKPSSRNQLITVVKPALAGKTLKPLESRQAQDIFLAIPSIWSGLYRKSYLDRNNIRFLETPGASFQDLGFTFKLWAYAPVVSLIEDPILHYRQDNESSSVNDPAKAFCVFEELHEIDRVVADLFEYDQIAHEQQYQLRGIVHRIKYDNYLWNYQRLDKKDRLVFLQKAVIDLRKEQDKGFYDPSYFLDYQAKNHDLMLEDPEKFDRVYPARPTAMAKAWYYFKIGGLKALREIRGR